MKALNRALACLLATAVPLNTRALTINANVTKAPAKTYPSTTISRTLQILQQDPLLVYGLDISPEEKNALIDQVIKASQNPSHREIDDEQGLLHKVNIFEQLFNFNGLFPQPPPARPRPQQAPPPKATVNKKWPQAPKEPRIIFDHASMKDPKDWKVKYFDVVIVVNKSPYGQSAYVYQKFNAAALPVLTALPNGGAVSTGRETPELSNQDRSAAGMRTSDHAPKNSYFSNTPTGYFTPIRFSIDHVSSDWEDAAMDYALFFDPRGIATHTAPIGTETQLGSRASGGCIRMNRNDAKALFWLVRRTGGPVTNDELAGGQFERSSPAPSFANELVLELEKGFGTYKESPTIPVFDREGHLTMSEDGETPVLRKALARTLVVVENR